MHIFDGVLSVPVLVTGGVLAGAGVAIGLSKIKSDMTPQASLLAAVFFTASLIHVPIGPSSTHLILNGLIGLLMGWVAFPIILVGLILQALLFQFGGITVLGVNTFNVAAPAVLMGFLFRPMVIGDDAVKSSIGAAASGFLSVLLTALLVCISLYLSNTENFNIAAQAIFLGHIPVMIIEGIVTLLVVRFLKKVKPEILQISATNLHKPVLNKTN
ncbi:MAG: cobalt transporter CbiM [Deltaproteobacteria bacterium]|jgi:cobalt/nickel transport system permease protein|nr:cobalt transporter CbiM [Deltaproteobacteria bacterium]